MIQSVWKNLPGLNLMMSERSHRPNPAAHSRSRPTRAKMGGPSLTHRPYPTANPTISFSSWTPLVWLLMQTLSQKCITKHQWLVHSLYGQKYWNIPFFRREKALPNCGNKEINVLKNCMSTSVAAVLKCMKWLYPYVQVIGIWWWSSGSRSAFKVTPEVFSWLSADQSSPSTQTQSTQTLLC